MNPKWNKNRGISAGPYEDLFIYYLSGRISDREEETLGKNFIGNWVEEDSSFLFFSSDSHDVIEQLINKRPDIRLIDDYYFTYEQWQGGGLETIRINRFLITPPWSEVFRKSGDVELLLDPGVVFGTGLHPTTRDCLKAICHLRELYPFERVLDLGTGTGILAISSAYLGAKEIWAIDLNPLAVKTARTNVMLNGFSGAIKVMEGRAEDLMSKTADLMVANIHYEVIRTLMEQKKFIGNQWFIISGLMRSQARDFKERILKYGLTVLKEWDHEMTWYTFLGRKGQGL